MTTDAAYLHTMGAESTCRVHAAPMAVWLSVCAFLCVCAPPGAVLGQVIPPDPLGQAGQAVSSETWAEIANDGSPTGRRIRGTYLQGGELYLRLSDLSRYLSAEDRFDFKNKYELVSGQKRLKFTLDSPSVVVDNLPLRTLNMPRPVVLHNGAWYAPAAGIALVLSSYSGQPCEYLPDRRWLNYGGVGLNLLGVEINSNTQQGTEVRIRMSEPVAYEKFFYAAQAQLSLTFTGARANLAALSEVRGSGLIRKVEVFQPREGVLQLTFHLSRRYSGEPAFIRSGSDLVFQLRNSAAGETITAAADATAVRSFRIQTIVIDAGHGGRDPGSIGPSGLREKDVALDIAQRLKERIERDVRMKDVRVLMTRDRDVFVALTERTRLANEANGDLFISIHANAFPDGSANGFMTFFLAEAENDVARQVVALENSAVKYENRSNALELSDGDLLTGILGELISTKYLEESQELAAGIQDELRARIANQVRARRVDQAGFLVLNGATMPGVLVEVAFISNRTEENLLKQTSFKNRVAEALHAALLEYRDRVETRR